MKNVTLGHVQYFLYIKRRQYIHIVNIQRLIQVLVDGVQKHPFDFLMRDLSDPFLVVGMVGCVLHQRIHNMVTLRAKSFIESGGNGNVYEWILGDSVLAGLPEGPFQRFECFAIYVDCPLQQLLLLAFGISQALEFRQPLQSDVEFGRGPVILDTLQFVQHLFR